MVNDFSATRDEYLEVIVSFLDLSCMYSLLSLHCLHVCRSHSYSDVKNVRGQPFFYMRDMWRWADE